MKVAAIIVTYNRKKLLLENIEALLHQSIDNDIRVVEQELITLLRELEANDDMGISALLELLGAK